MHRNYLFSHVLTQEMSDALRKQYVRRGFEILIPFIGKRSVRFTCYGWQASGVSHQDATLREIDFLTPFISWRHVAPEFAKNGFVVGGDVTPAMIQALLKEPVNGTVSPVFALKLEAEDSEVLFESGDYDDFILRLSEDEADSLRKSFKDARILVSLEQT